MYGMGAGGQGQSFDGSIHTHVRPLRIWSRERVGERGRGRGPSFVLEQGPQIPGVLLDFCLITLFHIFLVPSTVWNSYPAGAGALGCMPASELGSLHLLHMR